MNLPLALFIMTVTNCFKAPNEAAIDRCFDGALEESWVYDMYIPTREIIPYKSRKDYYLAKLKGK